MHTLTIRHGDYDDLRTLVHESENAHGWSYLGDGYWQFWSGTTAGTGDWDAIVADLRSAVDVKQLDPETAQSEDQVTTAQDPSVRRLNPSERRLG